MSQFTKEESEEANQSGHPLAEYRRLIQSTDLQKGYQAFVKLFRAMRTFMEIEMPAYSFTGNIVENNMDYSYFQFTDDALKLAGLKIVIVFVHKDFEFQIWLSGVNRKTQSAWHTRLSTREHPYVLTDNPNNTDYILKSPLTSDWDFDDPIKLYNTVKAKAVVFCQQVKQLQDNM